MDIKPNTIRLSYEQLEAIRRRFPKDIELSLENYLPGKVHADIYEVLPVGKQAFLWFTFLENTHASFVVTKTTRGYKFDLIPACFSNDLAYGTVLSGVFTIRSNSDRNPHGFFCADDILYYKGRRIFSEAKPLSRRLDVIARMFATNEVGNLGPTNGVLSLCMPIMTNDYTVAQGYLSSLPYPTYGLKMLNISDTKALGVLANSSKRTDQSDIKCVFLVEANTDPDSYTLFGEHPEKRNNMRQSVGLALIPTYADSVRMNLLFRNIRENVSIDYIEESEDEDDFENVSQTKYLLEGASYKMVCSYSKTTNKWIPESIASDDAVLSVVPVSNTNSRTKTFHKKYDMSNRNGNRSFDTKHMSSRTYQQKDYGGHVKPSQYQTQRNHIQTSNNKHPDFHQTRKPIFSVYKRPANRITQ